MAAALVVSAGPAREASMPAAGLEVVATGVPRPLQLVLDRRTLVVLGPGARGDSAGEIYRVDLDGVGELRAYLDRFWTKSLDAFKQAAERHDEEVS